MECGKAFEPRAFSTTSMPMPAGSPRAITIVCLGLIRSGKPIAVLRFLLLGLLLVGLATGLRNQWLVIHWDRFADDLGLPLNPADDDSSTFNQWLIGEP